MIEFNIGKVAVTIQDGRHEFIGTPPSRWRTDRQELTGEAVIGNLRADDGLRAQVFLVFWPQDDEVSLGYLDLFDGPADYQRLEAAGLISPKLVDGGLVAVLRAMKYGTAGRATASGTNWEQIDEWVGGDSRKALKDLGATAVGEYGELLTSAARFKAEPALRVSLDDPRALFAVYALTRVIPIMTGYGKPEIEGPNL
ncbi:MAG: hypothetical protein IT192_07115 [Microbacteriaceae bacterium]|nr:hypothetical protein [Microbacteriaceae bacterium]